MGGVTASMRFLGGLLFSGVFSVEGVLPGLGGGLVNGLGVLVSGPAEGTLTGLVVTLTFLAFSSCCFLLLIALIWVAAILKLRPSRVF